MRAALKVYTVCYCYSVKKLSCFVVDKKSEGGMYMAVVESVLSTSD